MDEYREANRALWNTWARINLESKLYDVEAFAAGRGRDLDPIARTGPGDVRGKSLLHLRCHFGSLLYPYFHGPEPVRDEHPGCYSTPDAPITSVEHVCLHTLSDVIGALARAGLRITAFDEYPFLGWRFFPWMEQGADGWWRLPEDPRLPHGRGSLPLMFSLKAVGPA